MPLRLFILVSSLIYISKLYVYTVYDEFSDAKFTLFYNFRLKVYQVLEVLLFWVVVCRVLLKDSICRLKSFLIWKLYSSNLCTDLQHDESDEVVRSSFLSESGVVNSRITWRDRVNKQPKIIFYWNTFYNQTDMTFRFGQQPFLKIGCKNSNCIASNDRRLFNQSVGILIHACHCSEDDLPSHRFPNRRFIFLNHQPLIPAFPADGSHLLCFSRPYFYNWTMTQHRAQHRRDSDFHFGLPYGKVRRRKDVINNRISYKLNCRQPSSRSKLLIIDNVVRFKLFNTKPTNFILRLKISSGQIT